jgi:hypothetical protein
MIEAVGRRKWPKIVTVLWVRETQRLVKILKLILRSKETNENRVDDDGNMNKSSVTSCFEGNEGENTDLVCPIDRVFRSF